MAPRRRVAPESTIRDPGLRPLSTANAGFNDVSNLLRYQNQFRNVVDFTDLSSTLNRFVGYLADVKASEDRLSTEGGDLAGAVVESSLKNNYKTYNEMISSLTPEQQTALRSLGPVQTRVFAEQVSKHAISNLETKLAAAVKEESEKPLINDKGEINPPPNIVGRIQQVYSETIPEYDQMYGDVPLIRNGIRNLAGSTLSAYQAKAALVEGEVRANHNEAVYSANLAKKYIGQASNVEQGNYEVMLESMVRETILDSAALQTAGLKGNTRKSLTNRVASLATALANSGKVDIAQDFVSRAFSTNGTNGISLEMTEPDALVSIRRSLDGIETLNERIMRDVSKIANREETINAFRAALDTVAFEGAKNNANLNPTTFWASVEQRVARNEIPGVTPQILAFYKGKNEFSLDATASRIANAQQIYQSPFSRDAIAAIDNAEITRTAKDIAAAEAAIGLHPDPAARAKFNGKIAIIKAKNAEDANRDPMNKLRLSNEQMILFQQGDNENFFASYYPSLSFGLDPEEKALGGSELANIFRGYDAELAAIRKNPNMDALAKEEKEAQVRSKYSDKLDELNNKVSSFRKGKIKDVMDAGAKAFASFDSAAPEDKFAAAGGVEAAYRSLKLLEPKNADKMLMSVLESNPAYAIARIGKNAEKQVENVVTEFLMGMDESIEETLSSFKSANVFYEVERSTKIPNEYKEMFKLFKEPNGAQKFLMQPEFLKFFGNNSVALSSEEQVLRGIRDFFPKYVQSVQPKAESRPAEVSLPKMIAEAADPKEASTLRAKQQGELAKLEEMKTIDPLAELRGTSSILGQDKVTYPERYLGYDIETASQTLAPFDRDAAIEAVVASTKLPLTSSVDQGQYGRGKTGTFGQIIEGFAEVGYTLGVTPSTPTPIDAFLFGPQTYSRDAGAGPKDYRAILYFRDKAGKYGVSYKPILDSYFQKKPNPTKSDLQEIYTLAAIPSTAFQDGTWDSFSSSSKKSISQGVQGVDWDDFKRIWKLEKPLEKDDVRLNWLEDLSGATLKEGLEVGKKLQDIDIFKSYAEQAFAKHRRLNGASTPSKFDLTPPPATLTYDEMQLARNAASRPASRPASQPTSQPVGSLPLNLKVPSKEKIGVNYDEDEFNPYVNSINSNFEEVKTKLGIDDSLMREYSKIAAAIALVETRGGDDTIIRKWGYIPLPAYIIDKVGLGESRGITQINDQQMFKDPKHRANLAKLGITPENYDAWDPDMQAKATLSFIHSIAPTAEANLRKNPKNNQNLSLIEKIYYQYTAPGALKRGEAAGDRTSVKLAKKYYDILSQE